MLRAAGALALALGLASATTALGQESAPAPAEPPVVDVPAERGPPEPAKVTIKVFNASEGTVEVNSKVNALARIKPFVAGERMQIRFAHGGKVVKRKNMRVKQMGNRNVGKVTLKSKKLLDPGKYRAVALHKPSLDQEADHARSKAFHPTYPDLDPGNHNSKVSLFKNLLDKEGFYVGNGSQVRRRHRVAR